MVHEYIEDVEQLVAALNEGHRMVPVLVKAALKMADKINRRIG